MINMSTVKSIASKSGKVALCSASLGAHVVGAAVVCSVAAALVQDKAINLADALRAFGNK